VLLISSLYFFPIFIKLLLCNINSGKKLSDTAELKESKEATKVDKIDLKRSSKD